MKLLLFLIPVVTITSHLNEQIVQPGNVTITANAVDSDPNLKIVKVDFLVDGVKKGTDVIAPFSFDVDLTAGEHKISARAWNNIGSYRTYSIILKAQVDYEKKIAELESRVFELEKPEVTIYKGFKVTRNGDTIIIEK